MNINKTHFLRLISLFVVFIGLLVLAGWLFKIQTLKTILSGHQSMKVNTAILFILTGYAFFLITVDKRRFLSNILSVLVILFSLASLSQEVFKYNLGIDEFFIKDTGNGDVTFPGRPSPTTLIGFTLIGFAFLLIRSTKTIGKAISQYLLHVVTLISFIVLAGYIYMIPSLYKLSFITSVALHTGFSLFILSISASLINQDQGIIGLFTGKKIGNIISRRLFPQMVIVFLLLGYFRIYIYRNNLLSVEFGVALHVISSIIIVLSLVWYNAQKINLIDDQRKKNEDDLLKINLNLEKTIKELTEVHEKLDSKIKELSNTNKELETFNYISSHDLQEPLRKIKNFAQVLLEEEAINLTKDGKYYLARMSDTANNMQKLIDDLLSYYRTKNSNRTFIKTDLNQLVDEVIAALKETIIEKQAVVKCEKLCEANVIPFQFNQLFTNLIANALKFTSAQRKPEILISCKNDLGRNLNAKLSPHVQYCCITVSDNGIGFDVQYNERVFEIFERLHKKDNYPGTGVGLAICKKIAENHHGTITASSEVDKGAKFDIYIPL